MANGSNYPDERDAPDRMAKRIAAGGGLPGCVRNMGLMLLVAGAWIGINTITPASDATRNTTPPAASTPTSIPITVGVPITSPTPRK